MSDKPTALGPKARKWLDSEYALLGAIIAASIVLGFSIAVLLTGYGWIPIGASSPVP